MTHVIFTSRPSSEANMYLASELRKDIERQRRGRTYEMSFSLDTGAVSGSFVYNTTSQNTFCNLGLFSAGTHACFIEWLELDVFKDGSVSAVIAFDDVEYDEDGEPVGNPRKESMQVVRTVDNDGVTFYHISPAK